MQYVFLKTLPVLAIILGAVNGVFITAAMTKQADRDGFGDWVIILLPLIVTLVCLALSVAVLLAGLRGKGTLWGGFCGGVLFLVFQAITIASQFRMISTDGTAYWASAILPAFYVGLPLLIVGGIAGLIGASIMKGQHQKKHSAPSA